MLSTGLANKNKQIFISIIIILICAIPIFWSLGDYAIRLWDECRIGTNSLEMLQNHDFIVTHYQGEPDMWNTKPPLMNWLHVISMKILGVTEFAIRFPSALATFLLSIILILFGRNFFKSNLIGWFSALILVSSLGYLDYHITRTCEYDSVVSFFSNLYVLFYFKYLEKFKTKYLIFTAIGITCAILTKTVVGAFFLPGIFVYTIFEKKLLYVLKSYKIYLTLFFIISVVLGYYYLRELYNPGYINMAVYNDFTGRYLSESSPGASKDFFYYINNFRTGRFVPWIYFMPVGFFLGIIQKNIRIKKFSIYAFILFVSTLFIISFSRTKYDWYDALLYPIGAVLTAVGLSELCSVIIKNLGKNKFLIYSFYGLLILVVFLPAYEKTIRLAVNPAYHDLHDGRVAKDKFFAGIQNRQDVFDDWLAKGWIDVNKENRVRIKTTYDNFLYDLRVKYNLSKTPFNPVFQESQQMSMLELRYCYYLKFLKMQNSNLLNGLKILTDKKYNGSLVFYITKFNMEGHNIFNIFVDGYLSENDIILTHEDIYGNLVCKNYETIILNSWHEFRVFKVIKKLDDL